MTTNNEYLNKRIGIVKKLKNNFGAINAYTELFNEICPDCQLKVQRKPTMGLLAYCKQCQPIVQEKISKVRGAIK